MATSIADLFISVTSDVSGALSGLTDVDQKVNGTSASMAAAAPAALALAGAATAVGAAFVGAVSTAADFQHQMSGVNAVLTPADVNTFGAALSDLAIKLGKDTVFTSSQAAAGIEELIKAGISATDVLGGAATAAVNLAAATGTNVATAADIAAKAMNGFGLTADDLGRPGGVVDFLAGVVNATAADMDSLRLGFSDVGPVAHQLGLSFQDTATALGILANNGATANTAGTDLKTMLLNLIPQTDKQIEAFNNLGLMTYNAQAAMDFLGSKGIDPTGLSMGDLSTAVEKVILGTDNLTNLTNKQNQTYEKSATTLGILNNAFFDQNGQVKDLAGIVDVLHTAFAGMTPEAENANLQIIFGTQGMLAASIMATQTSGSINTLTGSIQSISAADAAKTRLDNLTGSMQQMGGSFEAVQIQIGTLFLPILRSIVDQVTSLLNAFLTLDPGIQTTIVAIVGIAGAAAGLLAGFILLGPVLGAVGAAFGILVGAIGAIALPLAAVVAAAALLYEAWQTDFGGIQEVTAQVWQAMQPAFQNIKDFIAVLINDFGPAFETVRVSTAPFITALSNDLAPILARLPDLIRLIGDGFNALADPARAIVSIIQILATGNYNGGIFALDQNSGVVQFFIGLHDAIAQFMDAVLKLLNGDFSGAWDSFWHAWLTLLQTVFTAQGQILQTIGGAIVSFLQAIPGWIAQNAPGMWQAFLDELGRLPSQLQPYWDAFAGWLGNVLSGVPGFIGSNLGDLWGALVAAFGDLVPQLAPAWDSFAGWLGAVLGGIPQFVGDMAGDIWAGLRAAFEGLVDQLSPAWDSFAGWFAAVLGGIPQFVGDMAGDVWAALRTAFEGIVDQLAPAWDVFAGWLGAVLGGIPQFVGDNMGDVWVALSTAFGGLVDMLAPAWDVFAGWFLAVLQGLPQFVIDNIGDVFGGIVDQAGALVQRIADAIDPIRQLIADTFGNVWNWVTGGSTPGASGSGATSPEPVPAGGAGGAGGPLVSIGTLYISSQAEMDAFLQQMSDAILASTRRVNAPALG